MMRSVGRRGRKRSSAPFLSNCGDLDDGIVAYAEKAIAGTVL